jgi:Immunoglobulin domain
MFQLFHVLTSEFCEFCITHSTHLFYKFFRRAPVIKPFEQQYAVAQGTDFEITCDAPGQPVPTITWSLVRLKNSIGNRDMKINRFLIQNSGPLASNARQTGNVLRILNVRPENSGVYVCVASNNAGSDQAATLIDVERKYCS